MFRIRCFLRFCAPPPPPLSPHSSAERGCQGSGTVPTSSMSMARRELVCIRQNKNTSKCRSLSTNRELNTPSFHTPSRTHGRLFRRNEKKSRKGRNGRPFLFFNKQTKNPNFGFPFWIIPFAFFACVSIVITLSLSEIANVFSLVSRRRSPRTTPRGGRIKGNNRIMTMYIYIYILIDNDQRERAGNGTAG